MKTFFGSLEQDRELEELNQVFWRCLLGFARLDVSRSSVTSVLDIGCHRGGLLELFARHYKPHTIWGLEPLDAARQEARFRLSSLASEVNLLPSEQWSQVPSGSVDLATCHEVLHLVGDVEVFFGELHRVLRPGAFAYVALGCHSENPLWSSWKRSLIELGHEVFDHAPLDLLAAASRAGFQHAVRPLRREGWVQHDPLAAADTYPNAATMFDHHYRQKLLFRLTPQGQEL